MMTASKERQEQGGPADPDNGRSRDAARKRLQDQEDAAAIAWTNPPIALTRWQRFVRWWKREVA